MPIYEYLCTACNTIFQFLVRSSSVDGEESPACPSCGDRGMSRVMSSFSVGASNSSPDDMNDDLMPAGMDEEDPRAMAAAIRRMADSMGEELEPEVVEALVRLESGEDPETVERELENAGLGAAPDSQTPYRDPGLYTP